MGDLMALLASLPGGFYQPRPQQNQRWLLVASAEWWYPVPVARLLGVRDWRVAAVMRAAGAAGPLDKHMMDRPWQTECRLPWGQSCTPEVEVLRLDRDGGRSWR